MDNILDLMTVASLFSHPRITVFNSARGRYRTVNPAYKSALRPAPVVKKSQAPWKARNKTQSSTRQAFRYSPLSRRTRQTRLVTLLPRSQTGVELRCTLEHISLDKPPNYAALSYTWGNSEAIKPITVNEKQYFITKNLDSALRSLQHENESLVLWIDSLCINQTDNDEKMHQVQQMAEIYTSAAIVLAWLGPKTIDSDLAIIKLDELSCRNMELAYQAASSRNQTKERLDGLAKLVDTLKAGTDSSCDIPIPSIVNFFTRDYWDRVWIQQELSLARDIVFVCGDTDIDKRHLTQGLQICSIYASLRPRSTHTGPQHWDLLEIQRVLPELLIHNFKADQRWPLNELLLGLKSGRGMRLMASDSRDYIYGFLGLATNESTFGISPDYSKSCAELYRELVQKMLQNGKLEVLRYGGGDRSESTMPELPSWVVDWSIKQKGPIVKTSAWLTKNIKVDYSAGGAYNGSCKFPSAKILTLSGIIVGKVQQLGPHWGYQQNLNEITRLKCGGFFEDLNTLCQSAGNMEYALQALWRVPVADREIFRHDGIPKFQRATEYSLEGFNLLTGHGGRLETLEPKKLEKAYAYMREMNDTCGQRTTFLTDNHLVGLADSKNGKLGQTGSKDIKVGDIVCIFHGASTPFILHEEPGGDIYTLVGEAFLHGVMDGEALEKTEDYAVRDFDIT